MSCVCIFSLSLRGHVYFGCPFSKFLFKNLFKNNNTFFKFMIARMFPLWGHLFASDYFFLPLMILISQSFFFFTFLLFLYKGNWNWFREPFKEHFSSSDFTSLWLKTTVEQWRKSKHFGLYSNNYHLKIFRIIINSKKLQMLSGYTA